jgi:uncharacterized membrane protein
MAKGNVFSVLNRLISELKIPVSPTSISEELEKHPEQFSLFAISELLNKWQVTNASYRVTVEELISAGLSDPFIASTKKKFVVVSRIDKSNVVFYDDDAKRHSLTPEEFNRQFTGNVLIAQKEIKSGEENYKAKKRKYLLDKYRNHFVIAVCLSLLITHLLLNSASNTPNSLPLFILFLLKGAGLTVSILLLIQSIDANNPLIQTLCGGDDNKNCNAILSSPAAKLTAEISWSEVGFFYFSGTFLALLFAGRQPGTMQLIAMMNILSLPYTFYSIYYQWQIAKQWCIFCCVVQGILWLELFTFLSMLTFPAHMPGVQDLIDFCSCMMIPIASWIFIKPFLTRSVQVEPLKLQLRRFKYNTMLFNKLLEEEPKLTLPKEEHSIIIGNRAAEHVITMVSNPYCRPCSKAHKVLDELLSNRDDIKLQVIFAASTRPGSAKAKMALHLLALNFNNDDISLKKALSHWYENKDLDGWIKKYPSNNDEPVSFILDIQKEWCKNANIKGTPAIFINGRKLPPNYKSEDIRYFL